MQLLGVEEKKRKKSNV